MLTKLSPGLQTHEVQVPYNEPVHETQYPRIPQNKTYLISNRS